MQLSKHFSLEEFTYSDTAIERGIDNTPKESQIENLRHLCLYVLEPLRYLIQTPIIVSSGFRSKTLNAEVGGTNNSQHLCLNNDSAVDCNARGYTTDELFKFISKYQDMLPFDQCINEFGKWIHISYRRNRSKFIKATKVGGKTVYVQL